MKSNAGAGGANRGDTCTVTQLDNTCTVSQCIAPCNHRYFKILFMQRPPQPVSRMLQETPQPATLQPTLAGTTNDFPDTPYDTESSYMPQSPPLTWMQQSIPPARANDFSPAMGISKQPRILQCRPSPSSHMMNSSPMQPYFPEDSLVTSYNVKNKVCIPH